MRITRGRYQDPNDFQCVTDPKKMEHAGKKIAFACCEANTCTRMETDGQAHGTDAGADEAVPDVRRADHPGPLPRPERLPVRDGSLGDGARRQEDRLCVLRGQHVLAEGRGRPVLSG